MSPLYSIPPFDCNVHVNFLLNKKLHLTLLLLGLLVYYLWHLLYGNKGTIATMTTGIIFFLVTQHPSSSVRTEEQGSHHLLLYLLYSSQKNLGNYLLRLLLPFFLPTTTQHHHYSWPYTTVMTTTCT